MFCSATSCNVQIVNYINFIFTIKYFEHMLQEVWNKKKRLSQRRQPLLNVLLDLFLERTHVAYDGPDILFREFVLIPGHFTSANKCFVVMLAISLVLVIVS